jgi:putative Holliday junction resolvase
MKTMGIDFGSKRVGVALSDEGGTMAFPYGVLANSPDLINDIAKLVTEHEITAIVLGESTDMHGNANKIMGSIEKFKQNIEAELDLPVFYQKEFMTSLHSGNTLTKDIFSDRQIKKDREVKDDSKSAALILQRYLDKKNN